MGDSHKINKKKCFVPDCKFNSNDYPRKIFIRLPTGIEIRKKWAEAVGRTGKYTVFHPKSNVYCCDDHFNLPDDVENWMNVKMKGARIRLKEGVLPFKRKPSTKSSGSLLKRTTIENPDLHHIRTISSQETFSSEDEIEREKTKPMKKYVKYCFVPNCNKNSLENTNKLYIRLPNGVDMRKKFVEVLCGKGNRIVLHESSEVFICSDHIGFPKATIDSISSSKNTSVVTGVEPQSLPLFSSAIHDSKIRINQENNESWRIETKLESEDTSKLRQLLCRQSPSADFTEMKSDSVDDTESFQIENTDPVLIKVEPDIPEYVKLEPETEENTSSEIEVEEMQILEEVQHSSEERETQYSKRTEISGNEIVVLRDDVPEHREVRDFLLNKLNTAVSKRLETPTYYDPDVELGILRNWKPCHRNNATSIEVKYLDEDINQSLFQERSSEVLKLLQETPGSFRKKIKEKELLTGSCNLNVTKKLVKSFPLRYTGLPPGIFKSFITNIVRGTKLPYNHVLLVLLKIREHQSFERLGDDFGISTEKAQTIFLKSVPLIANYIQKKVTWPQINAESEIPFSFDSHFENIKLIVDCLEIEVEKPKNAKTAIVLTNSEKQCYSVKYLISYTRMGLINCMSSGYGGSRSDEFVLETSGYLSRISFTKTALVLADKCYSESEELFSRENCKLVRLGEEVKRLEGFTCLKKLLEYVENIMKRLREFRYISRHAFLCQELTSVLDFVVIIACAIVNTQGSVIPTETDHH